MSKKPSAHFLNHTDSNTFNYRSTWAMPLWQAQQESKLLIKDETVDNAQGQERDAGVIDYAIFILHESSLNQIMCWSLTCPLLLGFSLSFSRMTVQMLFILSSTSLSLSCICEQSVRRMTFHGSHFTYFTYGTVHLLQSTLFDTPRKEDVRK